MFVDLSKLKIYVRPGATDMRKQHAGLAVVVQNLMEGNPFSGRRDWKKIPSPGRKMRSRPWRSANGN